MTPLVRQALVKADKIRRKFGLNMFEPINVIDISIDLGLTVRFVDINMEGMYIVQNDAAHPNVLISNQRPLPRRFYTCAHELGHHLFEHGNKFDALTDQHSNSNRFEPDEFLVDTFAGALLMPVAGISAAFAVRNWIPNDASAIQFYTICSLFGTGYQTLITHCNVNNIISNAKAQDLLKYTPRKILSDILQSDKDTSYFKIIDQHSQLKAIDLETTNFLLLPSNFTIESNHLEKYKETNLGTVYRAVKPGITRATNENNSVGYFIRIQKLNYIGLAEYRHLEDDNN